MTISECIAKLAEIKIRKGDIEVYFDCPKCKESFYPNKLVTLAIHLTEEKS